jgi:hypothetical protein
VLPEHPRLRALPRIRWDTVDVVNSTMEIHLLSVGVPALLALLLAALIYRHKGPHPETYKLSDPWTHAPILWAATEEHVHGDHGHGAAEFSVGGGASGKW